MPAQKDLKHPHTSDWMTSIIPSIFSLKFFKYHFFFYLSSKLVICLFFKTPANREVFSKMPSIWLPSGRRRDLPMGSRDQGHRFEKFFGENYHGKPWPQLRVFLEELYGTMWEMMLKWKYCWWKKSCTTRHVGNPVNKMIFTISAGAGFLPSTVWPHSLDDSC